MENDMAVAAPPHISQAGNVAGASMEEVAAAIEAQAGPATKLGPFEKVHVFWLAGMSCDGCSIAAVGATMPTVESLITGKLPGVPRLILHHTALQVEAGDAFVEPMRRAVKGELGAPYVIVYEGSIADESKAAAFGGYWSAIEPS
jgi:hydrogenase small subunit